jgi:putative YhdH/YhfP family quinone oxidoreductase
MRAFVISEHDGTLSLGVREVEPSPVNDGDVLVQIDYSGVNFKDAMVASAKSRVRRLDTLVGGVDAAGVVVASTDPSFTPGERVAVHGGTLGVARDGGFAEFVYAPTRYLSKLPSRLSTRDAMIIGTAGFTAMASVLALEAHGLATGARVLVTGATGGVGSQAVTYLSKRNYEVIASTGSPDAAAWLMERGAVEIIGRDEISDRPDRVLGSERWDGAVDCVGGTTLQEILRSLRYGAAVAASGLVASAELTTTVYPFITRANALLGIDAPEATTATRERVWAALGDVAPEVDFSSFVDRVIPLDDLPTGLNDIRSGATTGRILVTIGDPDASLSKI